MDTFQSAGIGIMIGLLVGTILCILIIVTPIRINSYEAGYKQGQIDVLSKSNIQYELVTNPDSTRIWVEIK